jgi:hypothetical protein
MNWASLGTLGQRKSFNRTRTCNQHTKQHFRCLEGLKMPVPGFHPTKGGYTESKQKCYEMGLSGHIPTGFHPMVDYNYWLECTSVEPKDNDPGLISSEGWCYVAMQLEGQLLITEFCVELQI